MRDGSWEGGRAGEWERGRKEGREGEVERGGRERRRKRVRDKYGGGVREETRRKGESEKVKDNEGES